MVQSLIFVYTIQIFIINSLHLLTKKFKNDIIKYIKIVKGVREKMSDKCLTVNELFSGIGTQAFALEYMKIPHKVVGTAEIEKNAIEAYNIAHGETRNYGDISKIESLDYADLWTYSFPCQDLSSGGKGAGINAIDEDGNKVATRSGLLWEVERLLAHSCGYDIDKKTNKLIKNEEYEVNPPKYLLLENVAELVNVKKHKVKKNFSILNQKKI